MPYGIAQRYLPSGSSDFHAFTAAEAGTRFSHRCKKRNKNKKRLKTLDKNRSSPKHNA